MSAAGHEQRARLKATRQVLGISAHRVGEPRQYARVRAVQRATDAAHALVDAPLDDPSLSTIERQQAVVRMLAETFPLATASLTIELPAEAGEVGSMGWQDMRALAARLVGEDSEDHQSS